MATGDTAPPLALSSPPPPLQDNTPSNLSSPLSEPEDKDEYGDESEPDMRDHNNDHNTPTRNKARDDLELDAASESDDDSKLSEVDVNDSEAETERLYDTPPKNGATCDIVNTAGDVGQKRFTDRRGRVFERSPSKLHQQLRAGLDVEEVGNGRNLASEDEEDNDDVSMPSSDPEVGSVKKPQPESPLLAKKSQAVPSKDITTSQSTRKSSVDSRKRKRSSATEHSESELPLKKRTGPIGPVGREPAEDVAIIDDEGVSTNPQSGNHTAEEDNEELAPTTEPKDESEDVLPSRSRKGKRSPTRKRKNKSPGEVGVQGEAPEEPPEETDAHSLEIPTPQPEEDQAEEVDEEAEEAHRNEEELKRKKAAWEELIAIEKQFSSFRERLYQERLEQLNQEEASLMGDNPTHPEYLAMLQCLEERRAEKIRRADVELQFKLSVLRHRAVAERAQIMSQFYQAVRESREEVLAELGQEWYEIQHERRRAANTIPDYGIRFPATRAQAVRNAVSYNKEVSVLSGFAKHVGFPAAPPINGASEEQLEADLEAIHSAREPMPRQVPNQLPGFRPDYTSSLAFGQGLGAAGEQFIEQTPWANPNHPSHQVHRQQAHREANAQLSYAVPSSVPRRYPSQPGGLFSSSVTTIPNGDSPVQVQKALSPVVPEKLPGSKIGPEPLKREPAIHAS
ncbi:Sds3-like-domain-containing protein [Achaetomium macrosporum]|uniref:Sds3-like-domain-containing protein n=1 Tax=Achaetomium macrosporum TaxID=79813 RepID=A0AAN7C9S3_9PEZI|nr:Sds3-like-domain-containing protein [Achaetomium macrosporum]